MSERPAIARLAVLGIGLIGGSLALALRRAGAVGEVVGCAPTPATREAATAGGVVDRATADPVAAVRGADMVVVATPLGAVREVFAAIRGALAEGAVVTDVGSVKRSVIADARAAFGEIPPWLVPGHPIAGTERSGVAAAFPELFAGHRVVLTPLAETAEPACARVAAMWEATGAQVLRLSPEHHDEVLAATSHLPHALAYALVDTLSRWDDRRAVFELAAGGFRDFTRIASSDPAMWRDICLANRDVLSDALRRFLADLEALTERVEAGDGEALEAVFGNARAARERFLALLEAGARGGSPPEAG